MQADVWQLFNRTRTIAVVGISDRPERPSHFVSLYMQQAGYRIIPVNPRYAEVLGQRCWPDLTSIPEPVDMVNVFRPSSDTPPIAREAIAIGAKSLWLQQGIFSLEAQEIALASGLQVVMDRCLKVEHAAWLRNH
jgi:predicted CoA-binding protein